MFVRFQAILLIIAALGVTRANAQDLDSFWNPPVQVFDTGTHPGDEAFYALAQDDQGSIIAGNSWGPVIFTGLAWELVPMPPPAYQPVYSLTEGDNGRVYFTAQQDFGYIEESPQGQTEYVSLRKELGTDSSFSSVHHWSGQTMFVSPGGVLVQNGDGHSFWTSPVPLVGATSLNDGLFLSRQDDSLCLFTGTACEVVLEQAALQSPVRFITDGADESILIGLDSGDLLTWRSGSAPTTFESEATDYLRTHGSYSGITLRDGSFFLWTFRQGGVLVDPDGSIRGYVDHVHTDVPNATINAALEDADGDLWLATNTALVHVAIRAPMARMPRFGPEDLVIQGAAQVGNQLMLGSNDGIWSSSLSSPAFEKLQAGIGRVFRMGAVDETPFVFSEGHLMAIEQGEAYETGTTGGRDIISGFKDDSTVLVGSGLGVVRMERRPESGRWSVGRAYELGHNVMDVAWDADGSLWTTVEPGAVLHIRFDPDTGDTLSVDHLVQVDDYPMDISQVESVWDTVVFVSDQGLVTPARDDSIRFDLVDITGGPRFDPPAITGNIFSDGADLLVAQFPDGITLAEDKVWNAALLPYSRESRPLTVTGQRGDRKLWAWQDGRLLRFDVDQEDDYVHPWDFRMRHVQAGDSTYGMKQQRQQPTTIERGVESVRFEFAAPRYRDVGFTRYRYRLKGLQESWSTASMASVLEFDVLKPGRYTLEVEGVDGQGVRSLPLSFSFLIRPPWYRSTTALGSWIILLLALMGGVVYRWQNNRVLALELRERELEDQVAERTREIATQKAEIEKQAEQLRELDESKSRFFANVSHEFRTPLTLITAPIMEALEGHYGVLPDHAVDAFERAHLNSDRLLRLVNQLLDLARLESGTLSVRLEKVDLAAFCRRIVSMFGHAAELRGISLSDDIPDTPIPVCIDVEQMEKVVVNLLSNALKFTPEGGRVDVVVQPEETGCRISVSDTGIGISTDALPRVFERFFQVDDGTTRAHEGMGIGLAMSRQFVLLHGGAMQVDSTEGVGSTFTFTIPEGDCAQAREAPVQEGDIAETVPSVESESQIPASVEAGDDAPIVLVVEDNADMRTYVSDLFRANYHVLEAENGAQGMEMALESIPDIVVSDLMMPEVDGIEFCRTLRADPRTSHIPFIMLTAKADADSRIEGLETGADLYLEKPFSPRELRAHLDNLVRTRAALQARLREGPSNQEEPVSVPQLSQPDLDFLERVNVIDSGLIFNTTFGVDQFADEVHMSRRQLLRKMKALLGETPRVHIQRIRFRRAVDLLKAGQPIDVVARDVGYADRSSFTRAFTDFVGKPPSEFSN